MRDLRHLAIAATAGLVLAAPAAHADILTASSFGSPDLLTLGVGSTLVANTGVQLFANSKYSGSAQEWVWEDTNSTFGKDDLTFVISVANNNTSTDSLGRITAGDFAGFLTDVGDNGGANGPNLVTRNSAGDAIGFLYLTGLDPGDTSALLMIDTNATRFNPGTLAVIDSVTQNLNGYGPAIPEPSTWAMMLAGFAALGFAGFRQTRKSPRFV